MSKRREKRKGSQAVWERKKSLERGRKKKPKRRLPAHTFDEDKKDREEKGIIQCWNCGRDLQAPEWIRLMAEQNNGEKTNKCKIECKCGESTDYIF